MPTVIDDFNDNSINTSIWTINNGTDMTVAETSSRINFNSAASYTGVGTSASIVTIANYDLTGKSFEIDIVSTNGHGQAFGRSGGMGIGFYSGPNSVACYIDGGSTGFSRNNNGSQSNSSLTYNSTHSKFRMEHNQFTNAWHFWLMISGVWTRQFISLPANWSPTSGVISIYSYIYGSNDVSITSSFDNPTIDGATIVAPQRPSFQPILAN